MSLDPELIKELQRLEKEMNGPEPIREYRLYYDYTGKITQLAEISPFPEGDKYIVVDKSVYENYFNYHIVNSKAERIVRDIGHLTSSLVKSNSGFRVVKNHAALLLEHDEEYSTIEYYDTRIN